MSATLAITTGIAHLVMNGKSMANSRKQRGMESEKLVAKYLTAHGFIVFETSASAAGTDIIGMEGVDWEIKARRGFDPAGVLRQLERRSRTTGLGIGVMRLNGQGEKALDDWCCIIRLADLVYLLKAAGYGQR